MIFWLFLLAIVPPLALLLFFYFRDRYKKEPLWPLLVTFLLGAFVVLPSSATSVTLGRWTGLSGSSASLLHVFGRALLLAGVVEEFWKFLVVRLYAYARPEFDEPYDGIMYAITTALGFATVENILYIFGPTVGPVIQQAFSVGVLRAVLAVPGHAFYGVLMGYFLGEAKFARDEIRSVLLTLTGLGLAILAHGVYDFIAFALYRRPLLIVSLIVFAVLSWVIFFKATRRLAEQSAHREPALLQAQAELKKAAETQPQDPLAPPEE